MRGGVLGDNTLDGADCGAVHGGDFFALLTGGGEVLVVSPAVHSSPQCSGTSAIQRDSNALNGCGAPPFEGTPQPISYGFERANSATG